MSLDVQITIDCADPAALARFWSHALGYHLQQPPEGFATWDEALAAFGVPEDEWNSRSAAVPDDGAGPRLFFQRVPEPKQLKNRLHLDLRVVVGLTGEERMRRLEEEAARLEAHGATRAYRVEPDPSGLEEGFISMRDPEGNEFCLD